MLFGTGKLKITIKSQAACFVCQNYTSNSYLGAAEFETADERLHTSDLGKKAWRTCSEKQIFFIEKIQQGKNQIFCLRYIFFLIFIRKKKCI